MIKVLGASGSLDKDNSCISFQLNDNTLIDAGNVVRILEERSIEIDQVFLTHAHFDHILDIPFLIETYFDKRQKPLRILGLKETLETVKTDIFNNAIWPKFQEINRPEIGYPLLSFHEIKMGEIIECGSLTVTAVSANHTEGSCGYLVSENGISCLITGDTYLNPDLVTTINANKNIKALMADTSFPSNMEVLAKKSKHLTPRLLKTILDQIDHSISVYPYHLKPAYQADITSELSSSGYQNLITKVLKEGDQIDVFNQQVHTIPSVNLNADTTNQQLQSLLTTAQALSSETNVDKLLEMILQQAMDFSKADAGTLYRLSDDQEELVFTVVQNRSLDIHMGGTAEPITWANLPLHHADGSTNEQMVATYCALYKKLVHIESVYDDEHFNFEGTKKFDASTGYHSQSMLVITLLNSSHELLGGLHLINKTDSKGKSVGFTHADQQNASALASQAAISLTNSLLIKDLETLFFLPFE